jgi:N-acetylated-alpha-linked acidic dipeptidase
VADPGFQGGVKLVRMLGTTALRLGESQILPFRFSHYARKLKEFLDTASTWGGGEDRRGMAAVDLTPAREAVARVAEQAKLVEERIDDRLATRDLPASTMERVNDLLARLEQRLLDEDQQWYRHVIYGWNIYSLYDGQPFPGLAEAIRLREAERAKRELTRITSAIERLLIGLREIGELVNQ